MARASTLNKSSGYRWVLGLLLGIPIGLLLTVLPLLGLLTASTAVVWALARKPRLWPASGILIGTGATYLLLVLRALADCRTVAAPDYFRDCRAPENLIVYQLGAAGLLMVGVLLLVIGAVTGMRRQRI